MAVQRLGSATRPVQAGEALEITARHDTYAISFELSQPKHNTAFPVPETTSPAGNATPPQHPSAGADPIWLDQHSALKAFNAHVGKAGAQDPLAFRRLARTGEIGVYSGLF